MLASADVAAEGVDFWEEHVALLEAARLEYGALDASVYAPGAGDFLGPDFEVEATAAPGVWAVRVASESYLKRLQAELEHLRASGIPLRRPNGMNRHGCILSHLGFAAAVEALCAQVCQ